VKPRQGLTHAVGGLGQHRLDRAQHLQPEPVQARPPVGRSRLGHGPEVAGEHVGPSNVRGRHACRPGHGLHHHAPEGTLPKLAQQQAEQESALALRGSGEQ
jgi:hypothetical protein